MSWSSIAKQQIVNALYPPRCIACKELTDAPSGLCGTCWTDISFFSGTVCDYCGVSVPSAAPDIRVVCEDCNARRPGWDQGRSAVSYEGTGRRLVLALKHGDRLDTAPALAHWLVQAGQDLFVENSVIVPIPLHWRRLLIRKFNQASELGRNVGLQTGFPHIPDALHRIVPTPSLKGKTKLERRTILEQSIQFNPDQSNRLAGSNVILIDDVMTTGATFSVAAEACRKAGALSVRTLAVARVSRAE